ncbi:hypothetical protein K737_300442 [Holospora undulata HU1]|uniref:Uncharacterized protein n=1 Tax=Holospora undulata HU1 TaxID=1321371 RepID=A0A061JHY8_9PROT|nr:hypothetical protein K737_300442 [Holospora undulata HU1]
MSADLQSAAFDRSAISPYEHYILYFRALSIPKTLFLFTSLFNIFILNNLHFFLTKHYFLKNIDLFDFFIKMELHIKKLN